MNIRICGTGSALPERKITNDDLSQIMDTSDEWISSRTGIKTRHLATEETTTSLATEAAKSTCRCRHEAGRSGTYHCSDGNTGSSCADTFL